MVNSSRGSACFVPSISRRSAAQRTWTTNSRGAEQSFQPYSVSGIASTSSTQQFLLISSNDMVNQLPSGQVFEPQVNTPALSAFAVIIVVFGLLQLRTNQVNDAAVDRKKALEALRVVKSRELANEGNERSPSTAEIEQAVSAYKECIETEERLRNVIPGVVRIVAPNGPASASEEEVQAAKQFLGIDLTEGTGSSSDKAPKKANKEEDSKMSGGAVAVLAVVGLTQIALLCLLSFDPMAPSFPM